MAFFRRQLMGRRTEKNRVARVGRVQLVDHEVRSPLVHEAHDGLTLAHLSDIHVITGIRPRRLHRAIEYVNARRPLAALLTGDYVCLSARSLPLLTEALKRLEVPAYATLGNHDHFAGADKVRAALEKASVTVLMNARASLEVNGVPLELIGVDDRVTHHDDTEQAFAGSSGGGTRIVLAHDPRTVETLHGRATALQLSGHTHGGQICLPKMPKLTHKVAERVGIRYLAGFYQIGETTLYVNRGLGAAVPVRLAAPMEVALLTLRRGGCEDPELPQLRAIRAV